MNYFEFMADYIGSGAVRLPVVVLSTKANIANEGVAVELGAEESAMLDSAWEKKLPCIVSVGVEGMDDVLMGTFVRHDSTSGNKELFEALFFHIFVGILVIALEKGANKWTIRVNMYHPEQYM